MEQKSHKWVDRFTIYLRNLLHVPPWPKFFLDLILSTFVSNFQREQNSFWGAPRVSENLPENLTKVNLTRRCHKVEISASLGHSFATTFQTFRKFGWKLNAKIWHATIKFYQMKHILNFVRNRYFIFSLIVCSRYSENCFIFCWILIKQVNKKIKKATRV